VKIPRALHEHIDTASQKVVATIAVGKGPWGIAVSR